MKIHNFYAGPCILPQEAIDETISALKDFAGTGISLASVSHRSKEFDAVMLEAETLFKELLDIPEGYRVIFLGGGASLQFAMVPFNLMNKKAVYLNTGVWAGKALKEATLFGEVVEIANAPAGDFSQIPTNFTIPTDADYMHITTNNTIYGTEIHRDIDCPIPLVADMSSDILSRPVDVKKYVLIYGGAQKNLAPAGVTFVIVKEAAMGKVNHKIPTMLNYLTHTKEGSMFNTPPVIPVYTALQTLKWIKKEGGVKEMYRRNLEKATLLYNEIDRNKLFKATIQGEDRSLMNICFVMNEEFVSLEKEFLKFVEERGMIGLKGHRNVGGFRASTYNALPKESVQALVDVMQEFEKMKA
ncbi:MAG TPA: 3-phosphoserine/phosphohydroxythreonine transaminase [Bacteroidales bacterium]|nr:3-phosphoserine/phosphohydroxythreonine transaminase [Bacteroidales bacterium]